MRLRSPIQWFGGKGMFVDTLLPLLPPHATYCEPCGGGASLLFAKPPSAVEVYNDVDGGLVTLFRVLRDPERFERFRKLVLLTPYSRAEYRECRERLPDGGDEIERAYRFYVVARQSFGGRFGSGWGYEIQPSCAAVHAWGAALDLLPEIHARLRRVQVEQDDCRAVIQRFDTPETLFYVDPPYVEATRKAGGYAHEMTEADHSGLVDVLLGLRGKVVLSGYQHPVYAPLEAAGWERRDFLISCRAAGRTRHTGMRGTGAAAALQPRTESVWLSPNAGRAQGSLSFDPDPRTPAGAAGEETR